MSLDEIQAVVLDVLRDIQKLSGRPWDGLDPQSTPIGELDGFDSLTAVEATVMIEEKLGANDLDVESLFVSEDGSHALTVEEIGQRLSKLLATNGAKV
jgi:acyl carrier protein